MPYRYRGKDIEGNQILVTESYENLHNRILVTRGDDIGQSRGIVLTGQPGTGTSLPPVSHPMASQQHIRSAGKTCFLKFTLARPTPAHQVALLLHNSDLWLLYKDNTYFQSGVSSIRNLPSCTRPGSVPIWVLVDMDYRDGGPPLGNPEVWPFKHVPRTQSSGRDGSGRNSVVSGGCLSGVRQS